MDRGVCHALKLVSLKHPFVIGIIAVIGSSALSSLSWVLEKQAISRLAPLPVVCVSNLIAGTLLIGLAIFRGRRPIGDAYQSISHPFILYSIARCAVSTLVFAYCLTLTSSSKMMFLTKIEPYVVLIIQILFYGHRTTAAHVWLLAVHIAGAIILSTGGSLHLSLDIIGDGLVFLAVSCNALLYVPSQRYSHRMGALYASGFSQLIGGVALLPFALLLSDYNVFSTSSHLIGWIYALITVCTYYIASTSLWFFSLRAVPAWLASALRCLGPLLGAPIAWFIFNEPLTKMQTYGAVIVVITSMWMVVLERAPSGGRHKA